MDWKLELIQVPVADIDRAKDFYTRQAGFTADIDRQVTDELRFVQLTPPGSGCSIALTSGVHRMRPGSLEGLQMVVEDADTARAELVQRGVEVGEVQEFPWGRFVFFSDPDGNAWSAQQLAERDLQVRRFTYAERPDLAAQVQEAESGAFPEFFLHDAVWNECWPFVLEAFPELHYVLVDEESGALIGGTNAIALRWDGTVGDLPEGTHAALRRSISEHERGVAPNTICGIQSIAVGRARGRGLSEAFVAASRERGSGFEHAITPLRALLKERYPLVPFEEYIRWRRRDESVFDPWLRVWLRAGAKILKVSPDSIVQEAPLEDWEQWLGMELPVSGEYVIAGGQAPLLVDRERDVGRYVEPHVWIELPSAQ